MRSRNALPGLLVVLVLLAGCAGTGAPGTESATPDPTATAETPFPTPNRPCTVEERPQPDPDDDAVEPADYPEPPANLTHEAVREYVTEFERAFVRNDALADTTNVTAVDVRVEFRNLTARNGTFLVRLTSYTNGEYDQSEPNGTPMRVYWDGAPRPVVYLVTPETVVRATPSGEGTPTATQLRTAPIVACP